MIQHLIAGVQRFQNHVFEEQREMYEELARGQAPSTLFITCADSRVVPNLFTQTEPGELFVLRNVGNLVPRYGSPNCGEGAGIEYAVDALGVSDIVVCGHSLCGAMQALLNPEKLRSMPLVAQWLRHAKTTQRHVLSNYGHMDPDELLEFTIETNVLAQIENLQTYPSVRARIAHGMLNVHAWVYQIETGDVLAYSSDERRFLRLLQSEETSGISPAEVWA